MNWTEIHDEQIRLKQRSDEFIRSVDQQIAERKPLTVDLKTAATEEFEDFLIAHDFIYGHDVVLSFEVFQITGRTGQGWDVPEGTALYQKFGGQTDEDVTNLAEADSWLSGSIKWDGCSDWYFNEQDHVMLHFCGLKAATAIGRLMGRMYDIASSRMKSFDRDLARMPPQIEGLRD